MKSFLKNFFLRTKRIVMGLIKFVLIFAFPIILFVLICSLIQPATSPEEVLKKLGADIDRGTVTVSLDTHGGFLGDGVSFVSVIFPDDYADEALSDEILSNHRRWKPLPLSDILSAVVYGDPSEKYHTAPHIRDENGKTRFPEIQNGYYYFMDRHDKARDKYDDSNLLSPSRGSFNYIIVIYDTDTHTMYYAKFDT